MQNSVGQGPRVGAGIDYKGKKREFDGVIEMFCTLIMMIGTLLYISPKTHQIIHLKLVNLVCNYTLEKPIKTKSYN